jgi:transcriptional regulator
MHPNPIYRSEPEARNLAFLEERGFGALCVNGSYGPLVSHVPFRLDSTGARAEMHLVRSNPIARLGEPVPALLAVTGPDAYISPDWYGIPDQVPTWNYLAVHLRGVLVPMEGDRLRAHLDWLSERFEADIPAKTPWTTAKMSGEAMERMMRQILPFELRVEKVDGTWKLGQNKPEAARQGAADGVEAYSPGSETALMAALMRGVGVAPAGGAGEQ